MDGKRHPSRHLSPEVSPKAVVPIRVGKLARSVCSSYVEVAFKKAAGPELLMLPDVLPLRDASGPAGTPNVRALALSLRAEGALGSSIPRL
jgi:hypothetical protein